MNRITLLETITRLSPAVSRLTSGHFLSRAGQVHAVSDSVGLSLDCDAGLPELMIDHSQMRAALSGLTGDNISMSVGAAGLTISSRGRRTVKCMDSGSWPTLPVVSGDEHMAAISDAIAFVRGVAANDMTKPHLSGVHFNGRDVVATNRYGLRIVEIASDMPKFTLPIVAAGILPKLATGEIATTVTERRAQFAFVGGILSSNLCAAGFPSVYRKLIPQDDGPKITVAADEMLRVVQSVAAFAEGRDRGVRLIVNSAGVTLVSAAAEEPIDAIVERDGEYNREFDSSRLAEMLSAYGKENVSLTLTEPLLFSDSRGRLGILLHLKE